MKSIIKHTAGWFHEKISSESKTLNFSHCVNLSSNQNVFKSLHCVKIAEFCSHDFFPWNQRFHVFFFSDKSGDVFQFSVNQNEGKCLLGHLSMLLDVKLSNCGKFVISTDRDEKIRVSHYPNAYNIHNFCLGHTDFVTSLELLTNQGNFYIT